jgi:hypothetical protein
VAGHLVVTVTMDRLGGSTGYGVDLGADGSEELAGTNQSAAEHFVEIPVTLGPEPMRIQLRAYCRVDALNGAGSNYVVYAVRFQAAPGRIEPVGVACGPRLEAMLRNDTTGARLTLAIGAAPATPHTFLVFGTQPEQIVIPPTNCMLLQDLAVAVPIGVTGGGAVLDVPLPFPLPPADLRTQFLAGVVQDQVAYWYSSEGLRLRMP